MFYYIIGTTYQKIGDLFWLVIFLDFRTVWTVEVISNEIGAYSMKPKRNKQLPMISITIDLYILCIKLVL